MRKYTLIVLTTLLIGLLGCSEMTGEFNYMDRLKKSISAKYETDEVEINIKNNNELTVSLIDPKFHDFSPAKKEQIAREIGKLAQELREDKESIKSGVVNFRDEENYGIAKTSSTVSFQMYE
ncbi:hypothetical protein [Pontibacter sp. HSC-36F09]|uniref:hypothetical protein n=1 Tax=Pontibacter sp. HSC-36F09 TaxID=2910966 RepID=UPI00209F39ED|nr:hypothetical protein [Pontibacter sp. HSC-36F09]MCP2045853.1 putative RND superfamily exporter protein [Pontibacter sp. HSC-36F09]